MPGEVTRWGWHRLHSRWAQRLVDDAGIRRGDLVLDLGAGTGALTDPLVRTGATVLAFELHPQRGDELRARFAYSAVKVIRADVTNVRLPRRPFHVVSNPPFASSVAILRRLTSPGSRLVQAHVIVPRHTAERWVYGTPPGANRWRTEFSCTLGPRLPRSAFSPPPPNDVAILVIRSTRYRRRG